MRFATLWAAAFTCLVLAGGCGGSAPEEPSQDELGAYLADNPDVANEPAPPVEDD